MKIKKTLALSFLATILASLFLGLSNSSVQAAEERPIPAQLRVTICPTGSDCIKDLEIRLNEPNHDRQQGFIAWPDGQSYRVEVYNLQSAEPILILDGPETTYSFIVPEYGAEEFSGDSLIDIFCPNGDCWRLHAASERWWKGGSSSRMK